MSEIKIVVIGATGQGKSTIAQLVSDLLIKEGFNVINSDDDEINYPSDNEIQNIRIENVLARNDNIEILTQQQLR